MDNLTQLRKLGLFDARVPRYTSYPTAPHFAGGIGGSHVSDWIRAIPQGSQISLYLHVPFCRRLCWFCACRTQGTSTLSPVAAYVDSLTQELETLKSHLLPGITISHLHWGGGTPTLLDPGMIERLSAAIFDTAPLGENAQFSVEIDPNEIDDARMDALVAAGLNRASLGVQDFDPMIQEVIGRPQTFEVTKAAVDGLRARGVQSLNVDLLYGLPHQTNARMTDSVKKVLSLGPDRIALFGYAHVPWMARRQGLIPTEALPSPEERLELFNLSRDLFVANGFDEIGIDHFARPEDGLSKAHKAGTMHRNFQGYTEDSAEALIGIGASSISRYPQGYAQNAPATSAYQERVRAGQLPVTRGHAFTGDDILRGRVIEQILCDFAVDLPAIAREVGVDPATAVALAGGLAETLPGTVSVTDGVLTIEPQARPLARIIARYFDAYEMNEAGHSQAV
ncbi:oxygen-independent coproporphyrinogen-3 oxidase [Maritimibacter alkaliphilus HTCC2654]|uniref:Coproporphyrinogen-III oxidase n=1 Tax=Maritimibacter alkaliphilus HTCC2654 TaxID=314271 RepID=A3VER6_9RHOB|nr:oxygen-independent coproporphyrinogen III oxidase [Maritimibacter alkaliphilus]EAQ13404.1 coproporphyrinogen III oxidase [Rhodobacterales bacterium HTCC2654] [Maritimibacter alkaliphilus HTCC2654]TYP85177.1 oxygen-independent coproporphyrinogen-3 oxidase [Maritimibacter alkaliphilus HTCC2654]